jgi:hypothetical protein
MFDFATAPSGILVVALAIMLVGALSVGLGFAGVQ